MHKQYITPSNSSNLTTAKIHKKISYHKPESVKHLELLIFQAKRNKYPTIPINYLAPVKYRDDTANGLTKCIISFIHLKGGQAERISTTGRIIDQTQSFIDVVGRTRTIGRLEWIPGTITKGSADISAIIKGTSVKVEVKIRRDIQSEAQKKYQKDVESSGGVYYIAKDFTSFLNWYTKTFEL